MRSLVLGLAATALLVVAAPASATVTVAYNPSTHTTTFQTQAGDTGVDIRPSYYTGSAINDGGGKVCDGTHACDYVFVYSGSVAPAAGGNCWLDFGTVYCPDANDFVANLGDAGDDFEMDSSLAYTEADINGGGGKDTLGGTTGPLNGAFVNHDVIHGGPGDDTIRGGTGDDDLHGDDGNDTMQGGDGNDTINGDGGNDTQLGGDNGNDTVNGGDGDDTLGVPDTIGNADAGADTYSGGPGTDTMSYDIIGEPGVNVSLDGVANDGTAGEGDNVEPDIENITGSNSGDVLTGDDGPNRIDGFPGNDTINGLGGNDSLLGGADDDTIVGGPGTDSIYGDDTSCGFNYCPGGNDKIDANDGAADSIVCGPGSDTVSADALDSISNDALPGTCETITRSTLGSAPSGGGSNSGGGSGGSGQGSGGGAPGQGSGAGEFSASLATSKPKGGIKGLLKSGLVVSVTCNAACSATGTISIDGKTAKKLKLARSSKKAVVVGSGKGSVGAAGEAKVVVKLTSKAKKAFKKVKHVTLSLKVTATGGGQVTAGTVKVKL